MAVIRSKKASAVRVALTNRQFWRVDQEKLPGSLNQTAEDNEHGLKSLIKTINNRLLVSQELCRLESGMNS